MFAAGKTDVGMVRSVNQDRFAVREDLGLAILADGMGGPKDGDVAAQIAVDTTVEHLSRTLRHGRTLEAQDLRDATELSNRRVLDYARQDRTRLGMGTTLVIVALRDNRALIGNVGDSRCYLYCRDILVQVTRDHSIVQGQVERGEMTLAEARSSPERHVLTAAVGVEPAVEMDFFTLFLDRADQLLMCSDGLSDLVADEQIAANLRAWGRDPERGVERLVAAANAAGGRDNVTAVLVVP